MTSRSTVFIETSQSWSNNYSHFLVKTSITMLTTPLQLAPQMSDKIYHDDDDDDDNK